MRSNVEMGPENSLQASAYYSECGCIPMIQLGKEYTRHSFLSSQEPQRFRMKAFSGGNCKTVTNVKAHKKNKAH